MRGKLFGFALALVAVAAIGVTQLQANATTAGQVGSKPRCTVTAIGPSRGETFKVNGGSASITLKATGPENCRVQVSTNSFYAPSMNGKPYSKQILFDRNTKVFGPGKHTMSVKVPTKSNKQKGCYYQLDLTYGLRNVLPVLGYAHGKVNCEPPKTPVAKCVSLSAAKISRTEVELTGRASAKDGAKIQAYTFKVLKGGEVVKTRTTTTSQTSATRTITVSKPGTYKSRLSVQTSEGAKTSDKCVATFTVPKEPTPETTLVCDPETGQIIRVNKDEADNYVPVGDPACKAIEVCELETGEFVTIQESDFDSDVYSYNAEDCEEDTPTPPTTTVKELPTTGIGDTILQATGVVSLAAAGTYYWLSRRNS